MNADSPAQMLRYKSRAVIFILLLSFMLWGPFYRQVLHGGHELFRPWIMFKGIAVGIVDARYYLIQPEGRKEPLDRYTVLGYSDWRRAPKSLRRIQGEGRAAAVGRQLCKKLAPGSDVRVVSRIATRKGWRREENGRWNVCLGKGAGQ